MAHEVWLVNDDPAQLIVQKRLLERVVPEVREFLSPLEALAAARETQAVPYLVTDFQMPMMDGLELARQWYGLFPATRILIVSVSEVSVQDQSRVDSLPTDAVRLLSSYRIAELPSKAQLWFFALEQELRAHNGERALNGESEKERTFDPSVLEKLEQLGGDGFVCRTVERFLCGAPEKIGRLRTAVAGPDVGQLHALAHALKGSCGLVGALSLARSADRLEQAAAINSGSDWEGLVQQIERDAEATFQLLRARAR